MSNILERIEERIPHLSAKQQQIALAILKDPVAASFRSVKEFSENIGVSPATIVRFAQSMTDGGYPQLQTELQNYIKSLNGPIERLGLNINIASEDDEFLMRVCETQLSNLHQSLSQSTLSSIKAAVELILSASHVYTFGSRGTYAISYYLGHHLNRILKNTDIIQDNDRLADWLRRASAGDVGIFVGFPRYSSRMLSAAKKLKAAGASVIIIDSTPNSPMASYCDIGIYVPSNSSDFHNSLLSAMFISEMLISLAFSVRPQEALENLSEIEDTFRDWNQFASGGR